METIDLYALLGIDPNEHTAETTAEHTARVAADRTPDRTAAAWAAYASRVCWNRGTRGL